MNKCGATLSMLMLAALSFCAAQGTPSTPTSIVATASQPIEVPPFFFFGESQCDSDGKMYFHTYRSGYSTAEIFELAKDGNTGKFVRPTGKFADPAVYEFIDFWVSGDGNLSVLVGSIGHAYTIEFDKNGTMKDPVSLDIPGDVQLSNFAIFDSGYMLVAGAYRFKNASHRQGQSYQAILNPSGGVTRELSISLPDVDFDKPGLSDGGVASARGNLYFLGPDRIAVISPAGEVVRKLPFHKPDPKSIATKIYLAGAMVVVGLNVETKANAPLSRRFLVLDESTGEAKGYYQSPSWYDVCLTRDQELVFFGPRAKQASSTLAE